jgi:hypothetical protein
MKPPKFKKGDRCMFVYPIGKEQNLGVLDDNMVIADDKVIRANNDWLYNIVGKANKTEEKFLKLYKNDTRTEGKVN